MEKLFTKRFLLVLSSLLLAVVQTISMAKVARINISELKDIAQMVALVEIVSTKKTDQDFIQLHTDVNSKLIQHQAAILKLIKGVEGNKTISFLHMEGLRAGKKYLIFLSKVKNKPLQIINNQYGAFKISIVSMNDGVVEAVKIPASYVSLPKSLATETGVTARDEVSEFEWVSLKKLVRSLIQ